MPVRDGSIPPMLMFRSFLTIASGYVGHWAIVFLVTYLVSASFFPEYLADMEAAREQGQALTEADIYNYRHRCGAMCVAGDLHRFNGSVWSAGTHHFSSGHRWRELLG